MISYSIAFWVDTSERTRHQPLHELIYHSLELEVFLRKRPRASVRENPVFSPSNCTPAPIKNKQTFMFESYWLQIFCKTYLWPAWSVGSTQTPHATIHSDFLHEECQKICWIDCRQVCQKKIKKRPGKNVNRSHRIYKKQSRMHVRQNFEGHSLQEQYKNAISQRMSQECQTICDKES